MSVEMWQGLGEIIDDFAADEAVRVGAARALGKICLGKIGSAAAGGSCPDRGAPG